MFGPSLSFNGFCVLCFVLCTSYGTTSAATVQRSIAGTRKLQNQERSDSKSDPRDRSVFRNLSSWLLQHYKFREYLKL